MTTIEILENYRQVLLSCSTPADARIVAELLRQAKTLTLARAKEPVARDPRKPKEDPPHRMDAEEVRR